MCHYQPRNIYQLRMAQGNLLDRCIRFQLDTEGMLLSLGLARKFRVCMMLDPRISYRPDRHDLLDRLCRFIALAYSGSNRLDNRQGDGLLMILGSIGRVDRVYIVGNRLENNYLEDKC